MSDPKLTVARAVAVLSCALALLAATPVLATQKFGPIELSGNLQSQNIVRHPNAEEFQFIQNRNVARVRLDYDWLQAGKFMGNYDIPFIQSSKLALYWRGVYDSIYDTTPHIVQKRDIHERGYGGSTVYELGKTLTTRNGDRSRALYLGTGLSSDERNQFKFDNELREAYIDLKLRTIPLTVRAGKQQIIWGETDNFRMLDRANSLDLTWHFQQEIPPPAFGWDEIRQTFWMFKFLYDIGDVWGTNQNFLEWYWNPGDWNPARQAYMPRPWGLPFLDPLQNPIDGAFNSGPCALAPGGRCKQLMNGTNLFQQGDYSRTPFDNSQVGTRYHTIMPFGLEMAFVYFYQRFGGDDGTNYAPLRAVQATGNIERDTATLRRIVADGSFPAEAYMPYIHSIGMSANYSDEEFTQAVFRMETLYDVGIPFFDVSKVTLIDSPAVPGVTKKNMWKGMIAFDRPTWIRWLNKKTTWFLTGQFFWHYLVNNPDCRTTVNGRVVEGGQNIAQLPADQRRNAGSCLVGGLDLPSSARTAEFAFRDKIRDWEALFTFAAFSFYRGGSVVPVLGVAVDPVNQWNVEAFWSVDYVVRNDFVVNLGQKYFIQPKGHSTPIFETWGVAGLNAGRSETTLRITYQF